MKPFYILTRIDNKTANIFARLRGIYYFEMKSNVLVKRFLFNVAEAQLTLFKHNILLTLNRCAVIIISSLRSMPCSKFIYSFRAKITVHVAFTNGKRKALTTLL